jgi:hypothetical protein
MAPSVLPSFPANFGDRQGWFRRAAVSAQEQHALSRSRELSWSSARLITFLCIPLGGYCYLVRGLDWGAALGAIGFASFCLAVLRHHTHQTRTLRLSLQQDIIAETLQRLAAGPVIIREGIPPADAAVWDDLFTQLDADLPMQSLTRQELDDLDVFGPSMSLFGLLNRNSTPAGAARLADVLRRPLASVEAILSRQEAVRWLAENSAQRLQLMAAAAGMGHLGAECTRLYQALRDATPLPGRTSAALLRLWALAGPAALALGIAASVGRTADSSVAWLPLAGILMVNAVLLQTFLRPVRQRIRPWLDLGEVVERLLFFALTARQCLLRDGPPAPMLLTRQLDRLKAALARPCLPALASRIPLLYLGLSGLVHTIIDLLVFWDLQVLWLLERCYLRHRAELMGAFAALAECEMLSGLAAFAAEEPDACWPEFVSGACQLRIDSGRHPFLCRREAVCNSLQLTEQVNTWIITGSNMSGKSTFLRMAGVNVLLARVGAPATASAMTLVPLEILTDLRIRDDLTKQESYFLAEVRQVLRMVQAAGAGRPVLALIDEPFRGTNSPERLAASTAVISALIEGRGLHLIATHDAGLTALGDKPRAANHHFQESLQQGGMVFDYRLRPGPARSRNALNVLEAEGYPPQVVDQARRLLSGMLKAQPP